MSQVELKPSGRQPVPDLEDLESLKAYQTLRDALQGFEGVVMDHFFHKTPDERTRLAQDIIDALYDHVRGPLSLLDCGNQCPKGKTCVACYAIAPQ
jgi:hypothetical protein